MCIRDRVQRLPAEHIERDYLRLHEIHAYLDGYEPAHRPLAELLIVTGLRGPAPGGESRSACASLCTLDATRC